MRRLFYLLWLILVFSSCLSLKSWKSPPRCTVKLRMGSSVTTSLSPTPLQSLPAGMDPKLVQLNRLLINLWDKVAFPTLDDTDTYFRLADYSLTRDDVKGFLNHFQVCRDCAADGAFLMATTDDDGHDALQLSNTAFPLAVEEDSDDDWGNWDAETAELIAKGRKEAMDSYVPPFPIESRDDVVMDDTKEWVRKVIADFNVCPFTVDPEKAGIPMGGVRYTISRTHNVDEAFLRFWQEVYALLSSSEKDMSTILLVFPEIELFGDFEKFEMFCESLNDGLCSSSMCMENQIQLVFFHPKYAFRDGQARTTEEAGAANFARRGPWPMINILRTPQVRLAQKGVPTGIVYKQNEERLSAIGANVLEKMLFDRNWEGLPVHSASAAARNLRESALKQQEQQQLEQQNQERSSAAQCPFPHAKAIAAQLKGPEAAPSVGVQSKTTVKYKNVDAPAPPVSRSETKSPTVSHSAKKGAGSANQGNDQGQDGLVELVKTTGGQSEEELRRLAEEVEKWMGSW